MYNKHLFSVVRTIGHSTIYISTLYVCLKLRFVKANLGELRLESLQHMTFGDNGGIYQDDEWQSATWIVAQHLNAVVLWHQAADNGTP